MLAVVPVFVVVGGVGLEGGVLFHFTVVPLVVGAVPTEVTVSGLDDLIFAMGKVR